MRYAGWILAGSLVAWPATAAAGEKKPGFAGEWVTDRGRLVLKQDGKDVEGTYGPHSLEGRVKGKVLTFTYREGRVAGEGKFTLQEDGYRIRGSWRIPTNNRRGSWHGYRLDPDARKGEPGTFGGLWRTSYGTMELAQKGKGIEGTYGSQGWGTVTGSITGRRLELRYKIAGRTGTAWVELSKDGTRFFGLGKGDRGRNEWKWYGQRLEGHPKELVPKPGEIVSALAANKMTYHVRVPTGWTPKTGADAIVILHGQNMGSKAYVNTIAKRWPDLGARYVIIGIDGENWADWSEPGDPRHNYSYQNWMGRSTYKGYPNTHRESPALVAETLKELKTQLSWRRLFVGGHSQGGFLTWVMYMHFPEMFDGAFPISAFLLMQASPDVFDDEELRAAQRATPLAIVHAENDPNVSFRGGAGAHRTFEEHGFPALAFFTHKRAGHMFALLPVDRAILWLEAMSSSDPGVLLTFAQKSLKQKNFRDAAAAVVRSRSLELGAEPKAGFAAVAKAVDRAASKKAAKFLARIRKNKDGKWVESFLRWRAQFEFADAAKPTMDAFAELRASQEEEAKRLVNEGRTAMRKGDKDTGWAKYEELVQKCYASSRYRMVKGWLEER